MLIVIYLQTQNKRNALRVSKKLYKNILIDDKIPYDIKGYANYFIGINYKLQSSLEIAEHYFAEANEIFARAFKRSIYSVYYVPSLSHLAVVKALKGKIVQALELIKKVEILLQDKFVIKNLDSISKRQIIHSFNLVKFYVNSRLTDFDPNSHSNLIQEIYAGIDSNYSNATMLTEFLLNSQISNDQLKKLKQINNASIERIMHIINYLTEKYKCEKGTSEKERFSNCVNVLQSSIGIEKMTFIEKVYIDLLIAQSLFSLQRYSEIYPLLKKYQNKLNRIEVLEIRIFMEAFIQIGAFKTGNCMGPALQYIAIKRCRQNSFSNLETNLLRYLDLQRDDILVYY
ncbi:MAG: hypothetical protein H7641_12910 [Candidatus Heimdallarchaeota archaeon]|nr:hypothetical protein [Candidatus Heimdallarchaeota archaeon]MCK4878461.1 hypothetical protein [Candidatus Heimdallarchaeota archaeon]